MNIIRPRRTRPSRPDRSRHSDRISARNSRRRAGTIVLSAWLRALRGAVTLRQGRWLPWGDKLKHSPTDVVAADRDRICW